ncbi:glycosyltransferase [Oscillochloris sp. ZM17-4]|uniref:exopolysaccharide biosynthesis glycosyltransferase EpsD n=1 Tax=Oscillochloris sp. ZM17-4 TaxID=2866714 RepID=UPI001C731A42|nr:exopolysaccharide biosynthesis glycosyltransferase EpsD [Oscillochloris sp. ZM17-4]MBX0328837.1 glycosyltransferase [Oscillochloris sp. ZM17-4]
MANVSIVIPTYNRIARLKQVIAAIEQQTYPLDKVEVIIVSDGSTDGTHEYLANIQTPLNLRFVPQENAGPAAARNNGFRNAHSEYVLFIDDDVVPSQQLVTEHMRWHARRPNLVVLGPMLNPPDFTHTPWVAWEQAMLEKQYAAMRRGDWEATARQFYTGNTSLPRQVLIESGGFDERFRRAEDIELAYRLEKQHVEFCFTMDAVGYHYADRSFASWLQIPYVYGRYEIVFGREGQTHLLAFVHEQFKQRNPLIHLIVGICLDRPRLSSLVQVLTKQIADIGYRMGGPGKRIAQAAYSAIFNLRYYQGVADELGGRRAFYGGASSSALSKTASSSLDTE